jgi:hypothetical protein
MHDSKCEVFLLQIRLTTLTFGYAVSTRTRRCFTGDKLVPSIKPHKAYQYIRLLSSCTTAS